MFCVQSSSQMIRARQSQQGLSSALHQQHWNLPLTLAKLASSAANKCPTTTTNDDNFLLEAKCLLACPRRHSQTFPKRMAIEVQLCQQQQVATEVGWLKKKSSRKSHAHQKRASDSRDDEDEEGATVKRHSGTTVHCL